MAVKVAAITVAMAALIADWMATGNVGVIKVPIAIMNAALLVAALITIMIAARMGCGADYDYNDSADGVAAQIEIIIASLISDCQRGRAGGANCNYYYSAGGGGSNCNYDGSADVMQR